MTAGEARSFARGQLIILPVHGGVTNTEEARGWLWRPGIRYPVYSQLCGGRWSRRLVKWNKAKMGRIMASAAWEPVDTLSPLELLANAAEGGIDES